jgi:hypothetical protein
LCGSWGKGSHLGNRGARPARKGKGPAVGSRQRRRRDIATWTLVQETDSPRLQETVMHRVSAFVHCTVLIQYNHDRNRVSLYYLFQENKPFGTYYHLHSSSDVPEVVSSKKTNIVLKSKKSCHNEHYINHWRGKGTASPGNGYYIMIYQIISVLSIGPLMVFKFFLHIFVPGTFKNSVHIKQLL